MAVYTFLVSMYDVDFPYSIKTKKLLSSYHVLGAQGTVRENNIKFLLSRSLHLMWRDRHKQINIIRH